MSIIFRDVTPCILVEVYWHFRGMDSLHLHDQSRACCLLGLLSDSEDGGIMILWNISKHIFTSLNTVLFGFIYVQTWMKLQSIWYMLRMFCQSFWGRWNWWLPLDFWLLINIWLPSYLRCISWFQILYLFMLRCNYTMGIYSKTSYDNEELST
jgi:hypothetical protein